MLRFLTALSLGLALVFTGIGLMLSRQWGWSEYASNQLYVIYGQLNNATVSPFFEVNAAGNSDPEPLMVRDGTLMALNCSPDGRTLAFLTVSGNLTVINQSGVIYNRALGQGYDALTTANNGTVAVTQKVYGIVRVISPNGSSLPAPPDHIAYDPIKITSAGDTLWSHTAQGGIKLLAPSGETTLTVAPSASSPVWLAGEQMFTFANANGSVDSTGGMVDSARQLVVPLHHSIIPNGLLSPDASVEVVRYVEGGSSHEQLYLVDPLTSQPKQQLTHDENFHIPICFLTFRPHMLTN